MESEYDEVWLASLRQTYLSTAEEKIARLSDAVESYLKDSSNKGNQRRLHRLLHNLIGSGGSYGFPEVSDIARDMSDLLKRSRSGDESVSASTLSHDLHILLDRLRLSFTTH